MIPCISRGVRISHALLNSFDNLVERAVAAHVLPLQLDVPREELVYAVCISLNFLRESSKLPLTLVLCPLLRRQSLDALFARAFQRRLECFDPLIRRFFAPWSSLTTDRSRGNSRKMLFGALSSHYNTFRAAPRRPRRVAHARVAMKRPSRAPPRRAKIVHRDTREYLI